MVAHILVVDDDPIFVDVLTRFLRREGYQVSTAFNGLEALEKVKQAPPDLITLGVTMPEMDGFTACRLLKEDA
jgi:CheY-like chemotaxis protein